MRPLVGLDVDGVLYRWGKAARAVMFEKFGIEVSEDEWFNQGHCTREQWEWMWGDEGAARIFGEGRAFPGAIAFARKLTTIADVRIITAIPRNAEWARAQWLRSRGLADLDVDFVRPPRYNDGLNPARKSDSLPHCDVYVDDNIGNCLELAEHTAARRIILVDHTWNAGEELDRKIGVDPRIVRLRGWTAILNEVGRLTK